MSSKRWQPLNEKSYFSWSSSWNMLNFSLNAVTCQLPGSSVTRRARSPRSEARATYEMTRESDAGALNHLVNLFLFYLEIPSSYQLLTCSKAFNLASSRRNLVQLKQAVETEALQLMA